MRPLLNLVDLSALDLAELDALYSPLSPEERDEPLQCLLVAASVSGEAVIQPLEECVLELAGREFIEDGDPVAGSLSASVGD